jgi:D-serine deaminase-like pyridoxal phosphate-dependent protein
MPHPYSLAADVAASLPTPALLVYPDFVKANVARVVELAGGPDRLRPHAKTHKTREVTKLQLAAGVTKHKCATIAEAEMLASCGVPDVLLAYPAVGPSATRLAALAKAYPKTAFSTLFDSVVGIGHVSAAARAAGVNIGYVLDIDVGQHRTGCSPDDAVALYLKAKDLPNVYPHGLHAYDGHNKSESRADRDALASETLNVVSSIRRECEAAGAGVPRLVVGGTPGFPSYAAIRNVPGLECSPGTYVLHDVGYGSLYPDLTGVTPAAVVLTRVVSKPTGNRVTFDIGTKAVASDPPAGKRLLILDCPDLVPVGHNEEHYICETPNAGRYGIGDVYYTIPTHVCPTVASHREMLTVEAGRVTGSWEVIARDRKLTV